MSTATTTTEDNRRAYGRRAHSTTPGKAPQLYITHWSGIFSLFDCTCLAMSLHAVRPCSCHGKWQRDFS